MARYIDQNAAREAGYEIVHQADQHRFAIVKDDEVLGTARYSFFGDNGIDFDSTHVDESLRGTGLSGVLVRAALGDDIVRDKTVRASCWFVDGYAKKHPDALAEGATLSG